MSTSVLKLIAFTADDAAAAELVDRLVAQDSVLRSAAESVVAFLRGAATYESLNLGDTVTLMLPEEAGGTGRKLSRDELRDPLRWSLQADGRRYSLVPPNRCHPDAPRAQPSLQLYGRFAGDAYA